MPLPTGRLPVALVSAVIVSLCCLVALFVWSGLADDWVRELLLQSTRARGYEAMRP